MSSFELDTARQSIIAALQQTSHATEGVYLKLGQTYPALVTELDSDLGATQDLAAARTILTRTTSETLQSIQTWEARFAEGHHENQTLLEALDRQMERLGELKLAVEDIREDSVQMELLSLNAMVIAVKAGDSGRAFSCITDELKKTSNQTMELTEQIGRGEQSLGQSFADFKASLGDLNLAERGAVSQFLGEVRRVFQGLNEASQQLLDQLADIQKQTADVKNPLVRIVVEIQNQDRIRQSIDHVLLSLQEMRSQAAASAEAELDNLAYLEVLPGLCLRVLDEIQDLIRANRATFSDLLAQAQRKVGTLERERSALVSGGSAGSMGSLDHWFSEGATQFTTFTRESERLVRKRDLSLQKSLVLRRAAKTLVEDFHSFDKILDQFRNVDLAARIQVARHAALASMRGNATEMTSLTHTIEDDASRCIGITGAFFQGVEELFGVYRDKGAVRARQDEEFHQELEQAVAQLKEARDALHRSVLDSRVFTNAFLDQFSQTQADLKVLEGLVDDIEEQKTSLRSVEAQISQKKQALLTTQGLTEWKLNEDRLKSMVEHFTIFTHKKFAAQMADFELESSMESGEVTLF